MKLMKCLLTLTLLFTCAALQAAEEAPTVWAYKVFLATATDYRDVSSFVLPMVADDNEDLRNESVLDYVAEFVATHRPKDKDDVVARGHMVTALSNAENPRYYTLLLPIAGEPVDTKAKRAARKAVHWKKPPDVEQYKPGMVNLEALRDEFSRAALASIPTDEAATHLSKVQRAMTLAQVIEFAGKPHAVSTRFRRRIGGLYARLALYYRGLGRVELQYRNGRGWLVRGVVAAPLAFEDFMPYRRNPTKYGQPDDQVLAMTQLVSNDRGAIRLLLDSSEQYDKASLELMDTAAERLLQEHALAEPPLTRDLYNWMCVLLTHEGGNRYTNVLASVASTTADEKTRGFASEAIDPAKNSGAPPYVPGTVSLEAQRAKYPSLYPERTFYFGRL